MRVGTPRSLVRQTVTSLCIIILFKQLSNQSSLVSLPQSTFDFFVDGIASLIEILQILLHLYIRRLKGWIRLLCARLLHLLHWLLDRCHSLLLSNSRLTTIGHRVLLMFDHDLEPLLEVLLHPHSATLKQVLDALDFCFQIFQLAVLLLVRLFQTIDRVLDLILFFCSNELSVIVHHTSEGVLFPDLLDLVCQVFDLRTRRVNIASEMLASSVFLFKQRAVFLHGFVFPIALAEHVKSLCSVGQIFQAALNGPIDEILSLTEGTVKTTFHIVSLGGSRLLIELEVHSFVLDAPIVIHGVVSSRGSFAAHHLEEGLLLGRLLVILRFLHR